MATEKRLDNAGLPGLPLPLCPELKHRPAVLVVCVRKSSASARRADFESM